MQSTGPLGVYKRAMEDGVDRYLVGRPSSVVFRKYNRVSLETDMPRHE